MLRLEQVLVMEVDLFTIKALILLMVISSLIVHLRKMMPKVMVVHLAWDIIHI